MKAGMPVWLINKILPELDPNCGLGYLLILFVVGRVDLNVRIHRVPQPGIPRSNAWSIIKLIGRQPRSVHSGL